MEQSPSWEANSYSVNKFPAFYRTWRFITVFTRPRHWSLSWVRCIQTTSSNPISGRSSLILSFRLPLALQSGLFPSAFWTKYCIHHNSPTHAICPAPLNSLDLITLIIHGEAYMLRSSSLSTVTAIMSAACVRSEAYGALKMKPNHKICLRESITLRELKSTHSHFISNFQNSWVPRSRAKLKSVPR
jgi:hypothetical protein